MANKKKLGPATQAYLDTLRQGRLVQFTVDFATPNARGQHCQLSVKAFEYYTNQPSAFYPQLIVTPTSIRTVAQWVHHDYGAIGDALATVLGDDEVPADRTLDLATLTIHGKSSLTQKAAKALATALLAEQLGFTAPAPAKKQPAKKKPAKKKPRSRAAK